MTKLSEAIAPSFYNLHKAIKTTGCDEVWCKGGRGSTKSSFISCEIILGIIRNAGANALVCRRYDNELRDSVYGQMKWAATKLGVEGMFRFMVSPMQAIYIPTGQKIIFKGADNPLKVKSINLGEGYIKYAWFEEVDQFSGYEEVRNILQSLFRGEDHERTAFFSFNPPKSARSWVNQQVKIPKAKKLVHDSDYRSVPKSWLGERFIVDAEHLKTVNEAAYRHEYLGEETGTGLEVFNNVTIREITDEEIKEFAQIRQGIDWGYAVDPVVFLRAHYSAKKRTVYLFKEIAGIGISNRKLAERLTTQEKRMLTIADSAEPKSISEMCDDYGVNIIGCKKGAGSIEHGLKWLSDLENIIIDPIRCPLAAKEFVNYALDVDRNGIVISRYPDKDNHCLHGDTYIATINGNVKIKDIKIGDMILTRNGYRKCLQQWKSGINKQTYKLITKSGKILICTDNHYIYSGDYFRRLDTLSYGMPLLEQRGNLWKHQNVLNMMDISLEDGKTQSAEKIDYITEMERLEKDFMYIFGKNYMGKLKKEWLYTILTVIPLTMKLAIYRKLININIVVFMKLLKKDISRCVKILTILEIKQRRGTHQKKASNGINSMQKILDLLKKSLLKRHANVVINNISGIERIFVEDFAVMRVSLSIEEIKDMIILLKYVNVAAKNIYAQNMIKEDFALGHVQLVLLNGKHDVYDITVEGEHEFFANGILVHNCIDSVRYMLQHDIGSSDTLSISTFDPSSIGI